MTVGGLHPTIFMFCCPMASIFWYQLNAPRCKLFQQPPWSCLLVAISFQIALVALVDFQMAWSSGPVKDNLYASLSILHIVYKYTKGKVQLYHLQVEDNIYAPQTPHPSPVSEPFQTMFAFWSDL